MSFTLTTATRGFIAVAALLAAIAIMLGAYASHGMADWASVKQIGYVELASQYQLFHAIALIVISLLREFHTSKLLLASQLCLLSGCLCFSGSLYYLVFTGSKLFVMITPMGGSLLIIGWLLIAFAMFFKGNKTRC